jgi:hypothetical protein
MQYCDEDNNEGESANGESDARSLYYGFDVYELNENSALEWDIGFYDAENQRGSRVYGAVYETISSDQIGGSRICIRDN